MAKWSQLLYQIRAYVLTNSFPAHAGQDLRLNLLVGEYDSVVIRRPPGPLDRQLITQTQFLLGTLSLNEAFQHSTALSNEIGREDEDVAALCALFKIHCLLETEDISGAEAELKDFLGNYVERGVTAATLIKFYKFRAAVIDAHILRLRGQTAAARAAICFRQAHR